MLRVRNIITSVLLIGMMICEFNSCNLSYKNKLTNEVSSFLGKRIEMPKKMTYFGFNESPSFLKENISRIIVWCDSSECAACSMKSMYLFEEIANFCKDSVNEAELVFIFSPSSKEKEMVITNLELSRPIYDVYVDENGEMSRLNDFMPSLKELHVFLLDKKNVVQLSGCPVLNSRLTDMYKKKLKQLSYIYYH